MQLMICRWAANLRRRDRFSNKDCGYTSLSFSGIDGIEKIPELKKISGPHFLEVKVRKGARKDLGGRLLLHVKISRHLCWPVVKPIDMEYFNPVAIHFGEVSERRLS